MKSFQIKIINPKAVKLLQSLADVNLISMKDNKDGLVETIKRIMKKAASAQISLEDITKEVETVREKRYANKKKLD